MLPVDDFSQKGGTNGVEVGGKKSATRGSLRGFDCALFAELNSGFSKRVTQKFGRIDAAFFDNFEGGFLGVNIVEGEETGNAEGPGFSGDESSHPIVAVNEIGFYGGDDVVDDFALEGECDFEVNGIGIGVNAVLVVKDTVFCEVNAVFGKFSFVNEQFVVDESTNINVEHLR